jgi:hypothetical protein
VNTFAKIALEEWKVGVGYLTDPGTHRTNIRECDEETLQDWSLADEGEVEGIE